MKHEHRERQRRGYAREDGKWYREEAQEWGNQPMDRVYERHGDESCNFAVDLVRLSGGDMETEEVGINPWRNRMRTNVSGENR